MSHNNVSRDQFMSHTHKKKNDLNDDNLRNYRFDNNDNTQNEEKRDRERQRKIECVEL